MVGLCREGNCYLHLGCTFLDGGVKAEKDWLGPLLAPFISDAAKQLRVSDDMNQLYRAQAKGCGEGWDLYGNGEGAKNLRPFLLGKYPKRLFLKLERFDKGVRMWGSTKVIVFSKQQRLSLTFDRYYLLQVQSRITHVACSLRRRAVHKPSPPSF